MTTKTSLFFCLKSYGIYLLFLIGFGLLNAFIFGKPTVHKAVDSEVDVEMVVSFLLLAPIFEELIFRYILVNFHDKKYILVTLITIILTGVYLFFLKNSKLDTRHYILALWFLLVCTTYFLNIKYQINESKQFKFGIIILSSFLFGLAHMESYTIRKGDYSFIITFSLLIISGIILANVRMKTTIIWSMFTHFLINLMPTLIMVYSHFYPEK